MEQLDSKLVDIAAQALLLCLGIFMLTYGIRKVVETAWAGAKTNKWWTEVFLPMGPVGTGVILAFVAKSYAWPDLVQDPWSRAFYGGACGMASGWVYNRFRSILKAWSTSPVSPAALKPAINLLPDATPTSPESSPVVVDIAPASDPDKTLPSN